jgi:hypothetical protein
LFALFVLVVVAATTARSLGWIGINAIAASPARVAAGNFWSLIVSGLFVQKPLMLSLVAFAALGSLTLLACGGRVLAVAALLGHVCSTLLAYGGLALIRAFSPETFQATWTAPDYGVSAITAAWLGAIACVFWRRSRPGAAGKAPIVLWCLAIAAAGVMIRRHLNVLDSEHAVAFAIGILVSLRLVPPTSFFASWFTRPRHTRRLALVTASALVALVGASLAEALGSREEAGFSPSRVAPVARRFFGFDHGGQRVGVFVSRSIRAVDAFASKNNSLPRIESRALEAQSSR